MTQKKRTEKDLILFTDSPDNLSWDVAVDVLVIGAGGCGLVAALAAAQHGVSVFVVEKEKTAGGNTSLSQAMVPAAGTKAQLEAGFEDSIDLMTEDILKKNDYQSDPALTRRVAEEAARLVDWLNDHIGIELDLVTEFIYPGHSSYRIHAIAFTLTPVAKGHA
jgi:fumarate reductase flavoprotein subunit